MFSGLRMWIGAIGSALLGGLFLWAKALKAQRNAARKERDVLLAGRDAERKKDIIIKEEGKKLSSRRAKIIKDLDKEREEYEGVDNLTDPNDY